MISELEVKEENRKIRFLRFLVDLTLLSVQQDPLSPMEALQRMEDVRQIASRLFPGKAGTFDLIYRPRFLRTIEERFGWLPGPPPNPES